MPASILNIYLDIHKVTFEKWHLAEVVDHVFIPAYSSSHLQAILFTLPPQTPVLIWVHLEADSRNNSPAGITLMKPLLHKWPRLTKVIYVTSGQTKGYADIRESDKVIAFNHIPDLLQDEPPLLAGDIISTPLPQIEHFSYYKGDLGNWRINELKGAVSDETMKAILFATLGDRNDQYIVDQLKGGFSDTFVLKVTALRRGITKSFLLKITKTKSLLAAEDRAASNFLQHGLNNQIFIGISPIKDLCQVDDWYCLVFRFAEGKDTLRQFWKQHLFDQQVDLTQTLDEVFPHLEELQAVDQTIFHTNQHPFRPGTIKIGSDLHTYEGLVLSLAHQTRIRTQLELLEKRFLQYQSSSDSLVSAEELSTLHQFVSSNQTHSFTFDEHKKSNEVLTSIAHNDFHSANVMVSPENLTVAFIDFADTIYLPKAHFLKDLGKLSADLEISIFPAQLLIAEPHLLKEWAKYHKEWLYSAGGTDPRHLAIDRLYQLNFIIRNYAIKRYQDRLPAIEIKRQFQMVRLHYFLKAIGYGFESREKQIFLIRACLDILAYLK